jgi:hypothetical protein
MYWQKKRKNPELNKSCTCFLCGCARRCSPPRIAWTCIFRGCARRCSTRRIPCTRFFYGCARRYPHRRIPCTRFFCGCARRCSIRRTPSTRFFSGCARRWLYRRIPCTRFFCGCARRCSTRTVLEDDKLLLFIVRIKRELKRVYKLRDIRASPLSFAFSFFPELPGCLLQVQKIRNRLLSILEKFSLPSSFDFYNTFYFSSCSLLFEESYLSTLSIDTLLLHCSETNC